MIEAVNLIRRYGKKTVVGNISLTVGPGTVTGSLGPNGVDKPITMRMAMGLDKPTSGKVTTDGRPYRQLSALLREVGALLDAKDLHGPRSAHSHLCQLVASNGAPARRVDEILDITGPISVAKKCVKGLSLGMDQRLGITAALLGDPGVLLFDEPVNDLDPEGVRWVRKTCRRLAGKGRIVFTPSHLMSEIAQTADHLLVIGHGRTLTADPVNDVTVSAITDWVRVASPQATQLIELMVSRNLAVQPVAPNVLETTATAAATIGELAAQGDTVPHELATIRASLEEAYMALTSDSVEYRTDPVSQAQMQQVQVHQAMLQGSARG